MSGLFDILGVGGRALMTQQAGSRVASHNISNASTPGFHRQEALFSSVPPNTWGVELSDVRRSVDTLLGRRLLEQDGHTAFAQTHAQQAAAIEAALGPVDDNGLSAALDNFFGSLRGLANAPQDLAVRGEVLARTEDLTARVRQSADRLTETRQDTERQVQLQVAEVNGLLQQVADFNRAIANDDVAGPQAADLRDQRGVAVRRLGELMGATAFESDRGQVTVMVAGGVHLVQDGTFRPIELQPDPVSGMSQVIVTGGARVDLTGRLDNGQIGALLQTRDQEIPQRMAALDNFAFDLATALNAQHQANFGLDGVNGRDLFTAPAAVAGAAGSLTLDAALVGQPDRLGAALDPAALPGDGRGADLLVQIEDVLAAGGGTQTLNQALVTLLASIGESARQAFGEQSVQQERLGYLEQMRESQSGVSIEEQMLMLTRYQRAFQAATRVVTTVDEMLMDLLRM